MKPEYGIRKFLWNIGLVLRSDLEDEYAFRRQCQENSYKYFYKSLELEARLKAHEGN